MALMQLLDKTQVDTGFVNDEHWAFCFLFQNKEYYE